MFITSHFRFFRINAFETVCVRYFKQDISTIYRNLIKIASSMNSIESKKYVKNHFDCMKVRRHSPASFIHRQYLPSTQHLKPNLKAWTKFGFSFISSGLLRIALLEHMKRKSTEVTVKRFELFCIIPLIFNFGR